MNDGLTFTVLGARGSWPVSDPDMLVHGGRTTSFMIPLGDNVTVLVDAGTGVAKVDDLDTAAPHTYYMFLTHYHLDHIQGLQFFKPIYREANTFTIHGVPSSGMGVEEAVGGIYRAPWFPIPLSETASTKHYVDLDFTPIDVGPLHITMAKLSHPQGATGYRIEGPRATVVIATDHEAGDEEIDGKLVEFARGADYLLHDAQYTPAEHHQMYQGWGHSTWEDGVNLALEADVGQLILTSHDPARNDGAVHRLTELASARFPNTVAAYEGLQLDI
jgi:phosphoribosyl 1,2-cyclic phosphodiesterase